MAWGGGRIEQEQTANKTLNKLVSFLVALNPVVIAQISSYYVDGNLYCYFIILFFALINIEINQSKTNYLIALMSSVLLANIKLVGIYYLLILFGIYLVFLIIKRQKLKNLLTLLICSFLLIILSGINPYITNVLQGRNPIWPLKGKNSIDILYLNTPKDLRNKPMPYKFIMSLFSVNTSNMNGDLVLKIPFTVKKGEIKFLKSTDVRLSGFGVLFSGIFLLMLIQLFLLKPKNKNEKELYILFFSMLAFSVVLNPENWWARYVPQLWAMPIFTAYFALCNSENYKEKIIALFLLLCVFVNVIICFSQAVTVAFEYTHSINKLFKKADKNKEVQIYTKTPISEFSFYRKLDERKIKYKLISEDEYLLNKDKFSKGFNFNEEMSWNI